jgi:hypothetical protein
MSPRTAPLTLVIGGPQPAALAAGWDLLQAELERVFADKPDTLAAVRRVVAEFSARADEMVPRRLASGVL